ncbi:MAG: dephospho-CoA kinase [Wigglesworthia glossinidia]|nr:dephospho-CoA kinase [Wigglesworthia glossinidia]
MYFNKHINTPYIVGITGGIGSGKSTVAKIFAQFNIPVIESDLVAKNLIFSEKRIYKKIKNKLKITKDLKNTKFFLKEYIFSSKKHLLWINKLVHPIVIEKIKKMIFRYTSFPYIVWVSALLIENNLQNFVDRVLVVNIDPDLQLKRTLLRDKINTDQACKIINFQVSQKKRLKFAHDIIDNYNLNSLKYKIFFYINTI